MDPKAHRTDKKARREDEDAARRGTCQADDRAVEAGERMIYREDQSIRTHDFDLHRKAGTVAAIEVTSVTDGVVKATHAAIDRCRRIPRILCTKDWRIHPASNANIKRIAEKADAYLVGTRRFSSSNQARTTLPVILGCPQLK